MLVPNALVDKKQLLEVYSILDKSEDPESAELAARLSGLIWKLKSKPE